MRDGTKNGCDNNVKTGRIGERPYWALHLSLLIRVVHQIGAAVFLAACLLDRLPAPPGAYVAVAFLSGALLLAAEWWRHRQIWREFSGTVTFVKIALLGAVHHGFLPPQETVLLAFAIASFGAHAPKRVRHRLLF